MFDKKPEYWIVYLQNEGNSYYVIAIKRWKNITQLPSLGKRTYEVSLAIPTYINRNKRFYFVDFHSGKRYLLEDKENPNLTPSELDNILSEGIIRDITKGVADNPKEKILWFIMGCVIGALVCYVIASMYFNDKIEKILKDSIIQDINIPTTIKCLLSF